MTDDQHSSIVTFIWRIADDVLRDLYVRGKYRDVILPMTVLRRFDALLEPKKQDVLARKASPDLRRVKKRPDLRAPDSRRICARLTGRASLP
jgi:type I restriction-modification system DNA methylase subunit